MAASHLRHHSHCCPLDEQLFARFFFVFFLGGGISFVVTIFLNDQAACPKVRQKAQMCLFNLPLNLWSFGEDTN